MHAFLTHPAIQAVLVPFLVALLVAELLQRLRLSGLAIVAGFAITAYLLHGFVQVPLTGTRKIIWLGIASGLGAILLNLAYLPVWRAVLTVLAAAAGIWVALPLLMQHTLPTALQWGAGCALFAGWMVYWMDSLENAPVRAASAGIGLGFGSGMALLIAGASVPGRLDLAIGSAALAYLFIMFVSNSLLACGRSFTLPLALVSSLSILLAVFSGRLPWYVAAPFALIPLFAKLPVADKNPVWVQATLLSFITLACAFAAAYISWRLHGWPAL